MERAEHLITAEEPKADREQQGVQALETGLLVLEKPSPSRRSRCG